MTFILALLFAIPPCTSNAASSASSAIAAHQSVTVCTIPFVSEVPRGSNPQWVKVHGGAWSPTPTQLLGVRKGFQAYVVAQASKYDVSMSPWRSYTFQYQGQLAQGKRFLYIYAFCQMSADYPRQKLAESFYFVADGGPCYFQAWWSPESRSFVRIMFNGK